MRDIDATPVAPLDPVERLPEPLARMQFRGLGRQTRHMQAPCGTVRKARSDGVAAVDGSPIPDDDHAAGPLPQQVLQKGDDIVRVERAVLAMAGELTLRRQGTDSRERLARPPLAQDGCLPYRRIGAHDTREGITPRLVYKDDRVRLGFRPLWMAGQVSSRHWARAASSR